MKDGAPVPWPCEEPEHMDELRAEAGIEPFDEYVAKFSMVRHPVPSRTRWITARPHVPRAVIRRTPSPGAPDSRGRTPGVRRP
ncbi:hypothetical protein GCM10010274_62480 [Streptomyces lavendofoliae]|uniref:Uncharacterized protein n=1 Tax=Streptomyces lavendofoliae TaxID=67314 RepID=A0A918M850_9ACTN|nr:hypothetical protein GCM10010274_62480 [Streptomyces lavendofoliae]